jgi:hypothetical protein
VQGVRYVNSIPPSSPCLPALYMTSTNVVKNTLTGSLTCAGPEIKDYITVRSSAADLKWSKCTGDAGSPGILNVNFRPVVQGEFGSYDFKHATWKLEWRRC